jgi:hypothetical protein
MQPNYMLELLMSTSLVQMKAAITFHLWHLQKIILHKLLIFIIKYSTPI